MYEKQIDEITKILEKQEKALQRLRPVMFVLCILGFAALLLVSAIAVTNHDYGWLAVFGLTGVGLVIQTIRLIIRKS